MKISDLLRMSLESLFKRKVRTILTVLGVLVGTTSIVVMVSLGYGLKTSMMEEMQSYGSMTLIEVTDPNLYYNNDSSNQDVKHLDDELVENFAAMEHVELVCPRITTSAIFKSGIYEANEQLTGVRLEELEKLNIELGEGTLPQKGEGLQLVFGNMILSYFYNSKTNMYEYWDNGTMPDIDLMNDTIFMILDTDRYYMAGQPDENGTPTPNAKKYIAQTCGVVAGGPEDYNSNAFMIYCDIDELRSTLEREFRGRTIPGQPLQKNGKPYKQMFYSQINVYVDQMENVTAVQEMINSMGYNTYASAEWIEQSMQEMNIIQAVLGAIGAVSLFVAAIGITNTMMMSIYERTKEIGIMKVIGCRLRDIQALFLIEAGYIGFLGGTLGVLLSYGLSTIANKLIAQSEMGISKISVIPPWLALLSIVFAIAIGMFSGLLPSFRAMRLSPLAAIRNE